MARAGELGVDQALTFLKEVDAINMRRRGHVVDLARATVRRLASSAAGSRVLGAAFKPNSDDVRDSPALNVAGQIQLQGAQVTVYDPRGDGQRPALFPTLGYADSALEACADAHLVLHLTEWQEFRDMDPAALGEVVARAAHHRRPQRARPGALARRPAGRYRALGRP